MNRPGDVDHFQSCDSQSSWLDEGEVDGVEILPDELNSHEP